MTRRGDVVVVQFPYVSGERGKNRPALVLQCDRNNRRLTNTIVAMITGNVQRAHSEPTQVPIDPATGEGRGTGLRHPSAVKCENLFTIRQCDILRTVGQFSPALLRRADACLKAALGLR